MADDGAFRTPGQLIASRLEELGWSRRVLSVVLGKDEATVSKILSGKRAIDARLAIDIGELLDVAPERLLDLQKHYELAQARLQFMPDPKRATRARIYGGLPIAEMIARGWIDASDARDVRRVEVALTKFFRVDALEQIEILPHAAKKTNVFGEANPAQLAWLYRVREIASEMLAPPYRPESLRAALPSLRALLSAAEEARKVPRILAECGIRFAIIETLPTAKIDGVCFWLDEQSPVIAMTTRHDRLDNFWFVLRHEIEHVLQGHGRTAVMLDSELEGARAGVGAEVADEERLANEASVEFCVPQAALERFIARKEPFFAERDILGFARTQQIHPSLVAGQLQHRTGRYDRFKSFQTKVRSIVAPSAVVDGWGDVVPTDR